MPVYRAPLRSRRDDVDHAAAVDRALRLGVVGVGEAADDRALARLERFATAPDGSYVWTRHPGGDTYLGRIAGPLHRDDSGRDVDLVEVRDCTWLTEPVDPSLVPGAVRQTFARGGRHLQQIHPGDVEAETARAWDLMTG